MLDSGILCLAIVSGQLACIMLMVSDKVWKLQATC